MSDDADQLRALVSAMLSGTYKEEFYLWDVASLCRAKPEFARQLLALIDRYHRLGQMSAAQHKKIKDRIEQTVALRAAPLSKSRASDVPTQANTTSPLPTGDAAAQQRAPPAPPAPAAPAAPTAPAASAASAAPVGTAASARSPPSAASAAAAAPLSAGSAADAATDIDTSTNAHPDTDTQTVNAPTAAAVAALAATRPVSPFGRATRPAGSATPPAQMTAAEVMAAAQAMEAMEAALAASPSAAQRAPASAAAPIGPGTVLRERYELQALIGSGGMGSVYRALDRYRVSLGLPDGCVALKIVTAHPLGAASVLALGREFHNAQQLSHPSVVNVYEIDHEGDASFYTMELLDGERLSQLLDRIGGPLPPRYALAIMRDIGAAIAHAHARGVVHGDLKPHNIFVTYGGQVRVLDFGGLSHSPAEPWISDDTSTRRTSSYRTATPAYASCEQLDGHRAEPRDDIYAIACIAYELLTGNHPFDCTSSAQARVQRLRAARPAGLRAERWRALRQGLAWERAHRPDRIEPWLDQLGVADAAAHLPPTHQLTAGAPRGSGIGRAILAAMLLLALGCAVFGIEWHGGVDWRQVMTTVQSKWHSTWQQLRPPIAAPAIPSPATAAPAPPPSLPTGGTQRGAVRAPPRVAST
ncbi:MAG: serine/threonine-protein kinase, partial [Steroidobacteraceae bacterium]